MQSADAIGQTDIREFEIEIETTGGEKREYEYELEGAREKGKVEIRSVTGEKTKRDGADAIRECKRLMAQMGGLRQASPDEVVERACAALQTSRDQIKKLEVEVEYADGMEVEVKLR